MTIECYAKECKYHSKDEPFCYESECRVGRNWKEMSVTDIVERLRSIDCSWSDEGELAAQAADEIEGLRLEVLEQSRLLGMSGEREAGLRGEIERLRQQLAESQAREAQLREVLNEWMDDGGEIGKKIIADSYQYDDTALKEYRKRVLLEAAEQIDLDNKCAGVLCRLDMAKYLRRMAEE